MSWPLVRLDDCSRIVSGATPSTSKAEFWGGEIFWVTPADLSKLDGPTISSTPRTITAAGLDSCAAEVLPPNSVLFSSRAPIGHAAINTVPMATNQGFKSFVPASDKLDARYLYHWLRTNRAYLEGLGNGATFKEVSKAVVSRVEVPLPPLDEQRRIAAILDQADDLRRKRRKALERIGSLRQAVFLDIFGDPATNHMGWDKTTIGHALDTGLLEEIQDGNHGDRHPKVSDFSITGVPFITANCLADGTLDTSKAYRLAQSWLSKLRIGFAKPGDLLLSHKGTIGEVAIVGTADGNLLILSPQVTYYRPGPGLVVQFLAGYFRTPFMQAILAQEAEQSTRAYIGITRQRILPLIVPPKSLQEKFAQRILELELVEGKSRAAATALTTLLASLQFRAFRGEL